jgi:hypothetical protein
MSYEKMLSPSKRFKLQEPRTVSKRLKYCTSCKLVWELDVNIYAPVLRHRDFPTIGLVREECKYCKSE